MIVPGAAAPRLISILSVPSKCVALAGTATAKQIRLAPLASGTSGIDCAVGCAVTCANRLGAATAVSTLGSSVGTIATSKIPILGGAPGGAPGGGAIAAAAAATVVPGTRGQKRAAALPVRRL